MDFATLRALKPSEFSDSADGYRRMRDMASAAEERIEQQITVAMRNANQGEAATAALKQLRELARNFHYTQAECGLVGAALDGFAYDLEAAKKKLDAAVGNARAEKITVHSDGSISYPSGGQEVDGKLPGGGTVTGLTDSTASAVGRQAAGFDPNPHHRRAQEYADQIADALKEATEADEKWAPKLRTLKADDDLTVSGRELQKPLDGMNAIQSRFDNYLDESTRPYLLWFDDKKLGHVVMSVGNPDTADNVVTYVPGTGSKLSSIDGDISRAELLQDQATTTDPTHSTASVMWLGYDAPQSLLGDATDATWADHARGPLSGFLNGIDTAHGGHVNSTVLGHSYGTLVAGETMRDHPDLPVDNAILVGSPGVGVSHAKDLNIPADHVWAATAKNDLVNMAPPPAGQWAPLNPMAYRRLFDDHSVMYGNDPTSDEFGGRTFGVADGKFPLTDGLMPAHSQYWEGDSLADMAKIATGGTT